MTWLSQRPYPRAIWPRRGVRPRCLTRFRYSGASSARGSSSLCHSKTTCSLARGRAPAPGVGHDELQRLFARRVVAAHDRHVGRGRWPPVRREEVAARLRLAAPRARENERAVRRVRALVRVERTKDSAARAQRAARIVARSRARRRSAPRWAGRRRSARPSTSSSPGARSSPRRAGASARRPTRPSRPRGRRPRATRTSSRRRRRRAATTRTRAHLQVPRGALALVACDFQSAFHTASKKSNSSCIAVSHVSPSVASLSGGAYHSRSARAARRALRTRRWSTSRPTPRTDCPPRRRPPRRVRGEPPAEMRVQAHARRHRREARARCRAARGRARNATSPRKRGSARRRRG